MLNIIQMVELILLIILIVLIYANRNIKSTANTVARILFIIGAICFVATFIV